MVEMYAVCVLQIAVLLVPLDLFSWMLHELNKLLISAQFHLIHHSQGTTEFSPYVLQMCIMNIKYSSSHL